MKIRTLFIFMSAWLGFVGECHAGHTVKLLGSKEGLSSNYVSGMAQDKLGLIWLATEEGLNRFDGSRFLTLYKRDGLPGTELNCVMDDPKLPRMWIGTQRNGLCAFDYDARTFIYYSHDDNNPQSLITNEVTHLCHAEGDNIWVSTYWHGVDLLNLQTGRFDHYNKTTVKGLDCDQTWYAMDDGKGHLYVGHVDGGMSIIDIKQKCVKARMRHTEASGSIAGTNVFCIFKDNTGNIWVGTDGGLDLFDPEELTFTHFADGGRLNRRIFDIQQFGDELWVAAEQAGIGIIDLSRSIFAQHGQTEVRYISDGDTHENLNANSVRCMMEDRFGNIWAGLFGGGVNVVTKRQAPFSCFVNPSYAGNRSMNSRSVLSVVIDNEQNIWAGTDGKGVERFSLEGRQTVIYTQPELRTIQCAAKDSKGRLWLGNFRDNVYVRMPGSDAFRKVVDTQESIDPRTFYEDAATGTMWIGTCEGLYMVDMATLSVKAKHDFDGINDIRCVARDTDGRVWVGFFGGGLGVFDSKLQPLKRFTTAQHFPSNTISHICKDRNGDMWVATAEGLVQFKRGNGWPYKVYTVSDGLANACIHATCEDTEGNIWVSTNKGISCLRHHDLTFANYGYKENIAEQVFHSGAVATDSTRAIYFASSSGLYRFSPENVMSTLETPDVFITGMTIFRNEEEGADSTFSLIGQESIRLSYKENNFSVRFNIQDYSLVDRMEYSYRMVGLGPEKWHTTDEQDITFRDVPPGSYQLQVRCRIHNQQWGKQMAVFQIKVTSPFWQSWWAWAFYLVCIIGAAWYLLSAYKHRLRLEYLLQSEKREHEQQQSLNEERLRFYTNITHELRTPLTLILGPLEDMAQMSDIPQKTKHRLSVIHQSAVRLNNLISEILEFRKTETQNRKLCVAWGNIVEAVREVSLKYEELSRKDSLNIRFVAQQNNINVWFDKEVITIIVDNLVSNAIKYTEKGEVVVSIEQQAGDVRISVMDTGYGIALDALPHVFDRYYQAGGKHQAPGTGIGLSLVKNLVELHHATINVESTIDKGSCFVVRLQADYNYPDDLHAESETQHTGSRRAAMMEEKDTQADKEIPAMLIVEDNKEIRDYIEESFNGQFTIHTACDGKEGLVLAKAIIPDIIISDVMMPNMDGNEMCRKLKNDLSTSHIPIILLTAKDSLMAKEEGYDSGVDSYITKPFSRSLLLSRINNLLRQRKRLSRVLICAPNEDNLQDKQNQLKESLGKIDQDFYNALNAYIDEHISSEIDVNSLAEKMCMSASTLYRKMKSLTGLSTVEYIRKHKMQYAERLMLEGKYTVSEVAYMSGFNSINYFRRCFKEEYGDVPSEYLKKLKK